MDDFPLINFSLDEDDTLAAQLERRLLADLRRQSQQSVNEAFVLSARDGGGELIAGLTASTSYGWLLIKILWVDENFRRSGIGRGLIKAAEEKAATMACHSVWLDTSSPQAMTFYRKLGYRVFGELENTENHLPPNHHRWFMRKSLD